MTLPELLFLILFAATFLNTLISGMAAPVYTYKYFKALSDGGFRKYTFGELGMFFCIQYVIFTDSDEIFRNKSHPDPHVEYYRAKMRFFMLLWLYPFIGLFLFVPLLILIS